MRVCFVLSIIIFVSIFAPIRAEAGLGVSPAAIINERLVPGSVATAVLTVSRSNSDVATTVHVDTNFLAGNWITSAKGKDIAWPKGERQLLIPLTIVVPTNVSFGTYGGDISVTEINSQKDERYSTQTVLGAAVLVQLTVSNTAVTDFMIPAITIPEATAPHLWVKWKIPGSLPIILTVQNTGNTPTRPTKVQLDLYDQTEKKVLQKIEIAAIPDVPAFSTKEIALNLPHNMLMGEYVVNVKVFEGYRLTEGGERRIAFSVRPGNSVNHFWELLWTVIKNNLILFGIILGLMVGFIVWWRRTRRIVACIGIFAFCSALPYVAKADDVRVSVTIIVPTSSVSKIAEPSLNQPAPRPQVFSSNKGGGGSGYAPASAPVRVPAPVVLAPVGPTIGPTNQPVNRPLVAPPAPVNPRGLPPQNLKPLPNPVDRRVPAPIGPKIATKINPPTVSGVSPDSNSPNSPTPAHQNQPFVPASSPVAGPAPVALPVSSERLDTNQTPPTSRPQPINRPVNETRTKNISATPKLPNQPAPVKAITRKVLANTQKNVTRVTKTLSKATNEMAISVKKSVIWVAKLPTVFTKKISKWWGR